MAGANKEQRIDQGRPRYRFSRDVCKGSGFCPSPQVSFIIICLCSCAQGSLPQLNTDSAPGLWDNHHCTPNKLDPAPELHCLNFEWVGPGSCRWGCCYAQQPPSVLFHSRNKASMCHGTAFLAQSSMRCVSFHWNQQWDFPSWWGETFCSVKVKPGKGKAKQKASFLANGLPSQSSPISHLPLWNASTFLFVRRFESLAWQDSGVPSCRDAEHPVLCMGTILSYLIATSAGQKYTNNTFRVQASEGLNCIPVPANAFPSLIPSNAIICVQRVAEMWCNFAFKIIPYNLFFNFVRQLMLLIQLGIFYFHYEIIPL